MNGLTRFFLVLLRLAIGWHFLVEGVEKIQSVVIGPTDSSKPWTSEPYLREASGPLAPFFRNQFGDPDADTLARLSLLRPPPGLDAGKVPPGKLFPPALERDWQTYYDRFASHYHLDEGQRTQAEGKLQEAREEVVAWLLGQRGGQDVNKTFPSGSVAVKETPPERIEEYRNAVERLRDMENKEMPSFERDVAKQKLRTLKADVQRMRNDLLEDVNRPLKERLRGILTEEQKKLSISEKPTPHWWTWDKREWVQWTGAWSILVIGAVLMLSMFGQIASTQAWEANRSGWVTWLLVPLLVAAFATGLAFLCLRLLRPDPTGPWQLSASNLLLFGDLAVASGFGLSLLVRLACSLAGGTTWGWGRWLLAWLLAGVGAILSLGTAWYISQAWSDWTQQEVLDWLVAYGLTAVGVCLLLGFLTRPACLGGAALLLMFYLTMPPLPGVPDNPRAEGHYLFINKNLIECLALLALATLPSGRWLGLDGLFYALNPVRWFVKAPDRV